MPDPVNRFTTGWRHRAALGPDPALCAAHTGSLRSFALLIPAAKSFDRCIAAEGTRCVPEAMES